MTGWFAILFMKTYNVYTWQTLYTHEDMNSYFLEQAASHRVSRQAEFGWTHLLGQICIIKQIEYQ